MLASLLTITAALSQGPGIPQPCTYPSVFTADVMTTLYSKNLLERGTFSYDARNERTFEQQAYRTSKGGDEYELITLYQNNVQYKIDRASRSCTYHPIPDHSKFHPFAVPPQAHFHAKAFVMNEFGVDAATQGGNITTWRHVTEGNCMPQKIITFVHDPKTGMADWDKSSTVDLYNVALGIVDPSVFVPPASGCVPSKPPPAV
eukprot:gene8926-27428_t